MDTEFHGFIERGEESEEKQKQTAQWLGRSDLTSDEHPQSSIAEDYGSLNFQHEGMVQNNHFGATRASSTQWQNDTGLRIDSSAITVAFFGTAGTA